MSRITQDELSERDCHLIEIHQLEHPGEVYRIKPGWIRFFGWVGGVFSFLGFLSFILNVAMAGVALSKDPSIMQKFLQSRGDFLLLPATILTPLVSSFGGIAAAFAALHLAQDYHSLHLIVCEYGLLQTRRVVWRESVEVARWSEVMSVIDSLLGGYEITYARDGQLKTLTITCAYQRVRELIALIRQQIASNTERLGERSQGDPEPPSQMER